MNEEQLNDELQLAITRLIEGEAEPADDELIAGHIRSNPKLRDQLGQQLQLDALLRLEAEPTPSAFVESVAAQTVAPLEDDDAFLHRVSAALSGAACESGTRGSFRASWLSLRPATAALVGLLLGTLCTSVVFGYISSVPRKPRSILEAGFEDVSSPPLLGVPKHFGLWGGDYAEVVGTQNGVTPHGGGKMWRFLRADNSSEARSKGSYVGEAIHVVDLKPFRTEGLKSDAQIEISACFAQGSTASDFRYHWNIKAAAFEGQVKDASTLWGNWNDKSTSLVKHEVAAKPNGQWQRLSVTMQLPPNADFLVFECAVVQHQPAIGDGVAAFPAHYLDDVRVCLLPPSREASNQE